MAQISLKQIEAFVAVADLGSFRRAAGRLNTTQPNISTRIAALEARMDCRLMERDAGSVRLTPVGQTLLAKAREVLAAVDGFVGAADDKRLFEGVLRLGVTEMIVHSWLGQFLTAFAARYGNVGIDLTVDLSANLSEALHHRALDLALQSGPFTRSTSGMVDLGVFPMTWVAAPTLNLSDRVLSLSDLSAHPLLTHARGTLPFEQLRAHIGRGDIRLVPSTNMVACLQMTRDGLGVACLPDVMVQDDLAAGRLSRLRYLWVPDALAFFARYDADTAPSYVADAAELARGIAATSAHDKLNLSSASH